MFLARRGRWVVHFNPYLDFFILRCAVFWYFITMDFEPIIVWIMLGFGRCLVSGSQAELSRFSRKPGTESGSALTPVPHLRSSRRLLKDLQEQQVLTRLSHCIRGDSVTCASC